MEFKMMLIIFISNKYCYFELSIHQILLEISVLRSTTVFKIDNRKKCWRNQHIRMVFFCFFL